MIHYYFFSTLYYWKSEEVPLIFRHKTWVNFYSCLIKDFEFGVKDNNESQNVRKFNGYTAEAIINNANNISSKDKETVKEIIEHDGKNEYNINVTAGASSEEIAKQLVDAIRNIQNNR